MAERIAIHAHGHGSRALQGAADGGAVAEFGERLPRQPFRHQAFQLRQRFGGKAALLLQLPKLAQPLAIRRDELRDEALGIEAAAFGIAPPAGHLVLQVAQGDAVFLRHRLGDGRADAVLPSAGGEEPRSMGGVLHVVREGDDLLGAGGFTVRRGFRMAAGIVVVAGGEGLAEHHAEQAGRPRPDDDERFAGVAEGAVAAEDGAVGAGGERFRAERGHRLAFAAACAGGVRGAVPGVDVPAVAAQRHVPARHAGRLLAFGGEVEAHVHVAGEEAVVELAQIPPHLGRRGALHRAPAGDAALAALHQRQVQGGVLGVQVVRVAQHRRGGFGAGFGFAGREFGLRRGAC